MWISKKKYEELENRIERLESLTIDLKRYDLVKMNNVLDRLGKTLERSKSGEITYTCYEGQLYINKIGEYVSENAYTYIYSDFKEYKIDGLYLSKPNFAVDDNNNNLIHVKDVYYIYDGEDKRKTDIEFLIDLQNQTFIRTK